MDRVGPTNAWYWFLCSLSELFLFQGVGCRGDYFIQGKLGSNTSRAGGNASS
jgi:hypothetical protein